MQQSKEKNILIQKYGFYAYLRGLEKGLGIIVLDVNETEIKGIKIGVGKSEKISLKKNIFESLISYDYIEFVELLPKKVWKEFLKIYEK